MPFSDLCKKCMFSFEYSTSRDKVVPSAAPLSEFWCDGCLRGQGRWSTKCGGW